MYYTVLINPVLQLLYLAVYKETPFFGCDNTIVQIVSFNSTNAVSVFNPGSLEGEPPPSSIFPLKIFQYSYSYT